MEQKHHYTGLTDAQVLESRSKHGANVLTPPEKEPLWKQFLEKFGDPLIIILMIAGALSIGISCYEFFGLGQDAAVFFEPVGIFVAILLATGLAFYFELQADKEFTILNQVNDDEPVEVIRNGNTTQIPRKDIVVGDIVILNTGEEVPADSELLEATSLHMDESTLTGEPMCGKSVNEKDFDKTATYPTNHVMKGTKVMEGHGIAKVFSIGDRTEQGRIFASLTGNNNEEIEELEKKKENRTKEEDIRLKQLKTGKIDKSVKTPLNEQLEGLSDWITKVSYGFAALIIVGRIIMYFVTNGTDCFGSMEQVAPFIAYVLQTVMIAVTLVVVAVPEGLPMAVTLSLAYSMRRMLKTNNLVRKMHACETMGATTVICTDKTGTLTQNLMSVEEMKMYGDTPKDVLDEGIAVNSTASIDFSDNKKPQILGNPTEGALLLWLNKKDVDYRAIRESVKTVAEVPFSTERKYMATIVESVALKSKKVLYVKGAPEIIFGLCKETSVSKENVDKQLTEYQNRAMRTLGFAYQVLNDADKAIEDNKIVAENLCFIGVAAIADPVRLDVPSAIKECVDAGISVKIVTGDTPGTAKEIARQIGLWNDEKDTERNIITGPEFAALSDEELQERILDLKIISRARPMDKKRLVETLQKKSQVVAVTGDGTNDAPALRAAHVGLSMGDGTSVAKEASDITIIDNSFSSIGKAVMWGRSLYQNIQRFLLFQLTVNVTACFIVLCGAFMGTESPLTVTQMLWINLIMDTFAAMALASLPPSESVMKDKPRDRNAFILNKAMYQNILGVGGFFFVLLLVLLYVFEHSNITQLTDLLNVQLGASDGLTPYELTLFFTIFVMTHFFYLFCARAFETGKSALHFKGCKGLLIIATIILVGQIAMVEIPGLQNFFNVTGLKFEDWVIIIVGSSLVLWIREIWSLLKKI